MAIEAEIGYKICDGCKVSKPITEFYWNKEHSRNKGRYSSKCKNCIHDRNKERSNLLPTNIPKEKFCSNCGKIKDINDFSKNKYKLDKHQSQCKQCINESRRNEEYRNIMREWRGQNHEGIVEYRKGWMEENREEMRLYAREWQRNARKKPFMKLRDLLNNAMRHCLEKIKHADPNKTFRIKYLPYTLEELQLHLESLFEPWMTWENHGIADPNRKTWQIDHIIPQSLLPFDSFDHPNFFTCWALENLRPLEALENIKKGNKLIPYPSA